MAEEQAAPGKKVEKQAKRPSALKRDLQNEKRRLKNRSYRSSVQTAIRNLNDAISKKETSDVLKSKLNTIYSLMDKGVKKGVYKVQKSARTKSRLAARLAKPQP